jgi:hypothetical protein
MSRPGKKRAVASRILPSAGQIPEDPGEKISKFLAERTALECHSFLIKTNLEKQKGFFLFRENP